MSVATITLETSPVDAVKASHNGGAMFVDKHGAKNHGRDALTAYFAEREDRAVKDATPAPKALSCKVSQRGGVSVYGLNARFPVTLYPAQWDRLAKYLPTVLQFGKDNAELCKATAEVIMRTTKRFDI